MGDEQAQKSLVILKSAIDKIHRSEASSLSFEELYRNAYSMVLNKHGSKLYSEVKDSIQQNMQPTVTELSGVVDCYFLQAMSEKWDKHKLALEMIRDILMYLDRNFVSK